MGTGYGLNRRAGVFRTGIAQDLDHTRPLVDENTGGLAISLWIRLTQKLIAGTLHIDIKTLWPKEWFGPRRGVFERRRCDTWKRIVRHGLPPTELGKIGRALRRATPTVGAYALIRPDFRVDLWPQ